jgi:hypothetical protein
MFTRYAHIALNDDECADGSLVFQLEAVSKRLMGGRSSC